MDQLKQIKAIVEYCDWEYNEFRRSVRYPHPNKKGFTIDCPNILESLDAMHEAEKTMTSEQAFVFGTNLSNLTRRTQENHHLQLEEWEWHATAAQRAEVFLKTIRKWEE